MVPLVGSLRTARSASSRLRTALASCFLIAIAFASPLHADTFVLQTGGAVNWTTLAIWTQDGGTAWRYPGTAPAGVTDIVTLNPPQSYTMSFNVAGTSPLELTASCAVAPCALNISAGPLRLSGASILDADVQLNLTGGFVEVTGVTDTLTVASLNSTFGGLSGSGLVTITSSFYWSGGEMYGPGTTTIADTVSSSFITGTGTKRLYSRILNINANTIVDATTAISGDSATVTVGPGATLDFQTNLQLMDLGGAACVLNISPGGTLRRTGGSSLQIDWTVNNSGTIDVTAGFLQVKTLDSLNGLVTTGAGSSLDLSGGVSTVGAFAGAGSLNAAFSQVTVAGPWSAAGGSIQVQDAMVNLACPVSATSLNIMDFDPATMPPTTVTLGGGATIGTFSLNNGLLTGGPLTVTSGFEWWGGEMAGPGTTTIAASVTSSSFSMDSSRTLSRPLTIENTTYYFGAGDLIGNGGNITIAPGGTLDIQTDRSFLAGPSPSTLTVHGTLRKGSGPGAFTFGWPVTNTGTVDASWGPFAFNAGLTTSGTVSGAGAITVGTQFRWMGGSLLGGGAITIDGAEAYIMPGASAMSLSRNMTLNATHTYVDATLDLTAGAVVVTISPSATLELLTDQMFSTPVGAGATLINAGTLIKSGGAGGASTFQWAVSNSGTITAASGTLSFAGSLTNSGTMNFPIAGPFPFHGRINVSQTFTLGGQLEATTIGSYKPATGELFTVVSTTAPAILTGTFASTSLTYSGGKFTESVSPAAVTLTAADAPTIAAISPNIGSTVGGTVVTITGTGFQEGSLVTFANDPVAVTFVASTTLQATTPPHPVGAVDVAVTNSDLQTATLAGGFMYETAVDVTNTLDSGAGSLRQAIADANSGACGVPCTIRFKLDAIPPSFDATTGTFTITVGAPLVITASDATIDGSSEAAFLGYDPNPTGPEIVLKGTLSSGNGIVIDATTNDAAWVTVQDLVIRDFPGWGVFLDAVSPYTVTGTLISDCWIGTDHTGTIPSGNGAGGISAGNWASGFRIIGCVIGGNGGPGISLGPNSSNVVITATHIGTDASNTADVGNSGDGIQIYSFGSLVGYEAIIPQTDLASPSGEISSRRDSVRKWAERHGIDLGSGAGPNATSDRSRRHRPATRQPAQTVAEGIDWYSSYIAHNGGNGILLSGPSASGNTIRENVIFDNALNGISIDATAGSGNAITQNSIYANGLLGVNDDSAAPTAPPVISQVLWNGAETEVHFSTTGTPSVVEFFSSSAADPSGFGEGETYLGFLNHPGDGTTYVVYFPVSYNGTFITSTATQIEGSTSEFSNAAFLNSVPVATGDAVTATEDTTLIVAAPGVLSNDLDADGNPLSAAVATAPMYGTLSLSTDGSFSYLPAANFFGTDFFTYTASDPWAPSAPAMVTITVTAVNDAPVAVADAATTLEDTPVAISVLANDTDVDGTTPTLLSNTPAANGSASCSAASCTYTPNADFFGADSFTYTTSDGVATATATVTVTVAPVNDAPVAVPDSASTAEDTPVTISVLANDTDVDGPAPFIVSNTAPANGTASCSATSCTYTPAVQFNGTDSFSYTMSDGSLSSSATVTIVVGATNDLPIAAADSATTAEDTPVAIGVLANDSDPDGDPLSIVVITPPAKGTVSCAAPSCTYVPTANFNGTDSFSYAANDGTSNSSPATVTITITPVNDAPTAVPDSGTTVADEPVIIGVLANDSDVDGDPITVTAWTNGSLGTVACTAAGSCTYTPKGMSGPDSFTYTIADGSGATAQASVTINVSPCENVPPGLVAPPAAAEQTPSVTFEWTVAPEALRYHLILFSGGTGQQELALIPQPVAPLPPTITTTITVPLGTFSWWVVADFPSGCPSLTSADRTLTVVRDCPLGTPEPLEPLENYSIDRTPVVFRWSAVPGAVGYTVFVTINDSELLQAAATPEPEKTPSAALDIPAGATVSWYVEATLPEGCGIARSRTVRVTASCFPPVLSLQGEVTTDKPYQVRATIVSVGLTYLFEESDSESFATVLAQKEGETDPTGEFVFTTFEHANVTEPKAFYYRVRLAQQGCAFSDVGRIVVIPLPPPTSTKTETVVQEGTKEEIRQDLFIPSPTPTLPTNYTFLSSTDREWMRVDPPAGVVGPAGVTVAIVSDPTGLPVGTNTGTVTLAFIPLSGAGKTALDTAGITTSKPVSVTLVTPVTNRGKDAPSADSLIIPAVAHATGVNSEWQTDVRLLNMGSEKQKYALNLTVSGDDGTLSGKSSEIELAAGQNSALNDVVKQWYGLGSLPGEGATGTLEIRPLDSNGGAGKGAHGVPVTRSLVSLASSRTYNRTPEGTLGEHIPAIPFASFVGGTTPEGDEKKSVLSVQQLAQSSAYRSNLGIVEASGAPVDLEIRFFDAAGSRILTLPLTLKAGEHRQLNQVLAVNGLTNVPTARAEIEVLSGSGKIAAYASVVDNVTGDPLQVAAVDLAKLGARKYVMPGIAHFNTGQARWRTDVQLFNAGLAAASAQVDFFPVGASTPAKTATVNIEPGTIQTLVDIVPTLFGETNTGGAIQISTATNSELVVSGRTYDQREEGSYGQFMAAVTEDDAIALGDRPMQVLQMEQSSNIRSNLGIVEVSGKEVRVELTAHPAESRVTPRAEFTLKPNEFRQFNAVLKSLNAGTTYNARVELRVIGGDGKIVAYGSAVDNMTQDPTYIPGQ